MGTRNSGYHIAEDHIHPYITCNIEQTKQQYRLRTVIAYWGSLNMFYWIQTLSARCSINNLQISRDQRKAKILIRKRSKEKSYSLKYIYK